MADNSDIVDADIIEDSGNQDTANSATDVLFNLESMIKSTVTALDKAKNELRLKKEMLASALVNDATYREQDEEVKKATKIRNSTKQNILRQPENAKIASDVRDLSTEIKDQNLALSDYLREYARLSGTTEIEGEDGEVREIVYTAKLIKKSSRK